MTKDVIKFVKSKDFKFVEELGRGACGKTVKLYDEVIDEYFVCKKYEPYFEDHKEELFKNFVQEIKLLFLLNHTNIVRVFNYYIYPDSYTGYILMECVDGFDLEGHLLLNPENINSVFRQCVSGFFYLEKCNILHRDIRPANILVTSNGDLKIIDFGFGKRAERKEDFDKSITLNWWCDPPDDFKAGVYDFSTEVYFVGKLFEKIIKEYEISTFKYSHILSRMCAPSPSLRFKNFSSVSSALIDDRFVEIEFNDHELDVYRRFSLALGKCISKIEADCKYFDDSDQVQKKLENCYRSVMLEEYVPANNRLANCFLNGPYYYSKITEFRVSDLKAFVELLRSCTKDKKNIVLSNLRSRLDSIERYMDTEEIDDIPF